LLNVHRRTSQAGIAVYFNLKIGNGMNTKLHC